MGAKKKPKGIKPPDERKKLTTGARRDMRAKLLLLHISAPVKPPMLTEVLRRPEFADLPYKTVQEWKIEDDWDRRRDEFQAALFAQVRERVGDRLTQMTLRMLDEIAPVKDRLLQRLAVEEFNDVAADKLLHAFCKVMELQARLTEQAVGLMTPGPNSGVHNGDGRGDSAAGITAETAGGSITVEEARQAGLAIMRMRREAAFGRSSEPGADGVPVSTAGGAGGVPGGGTGGKSKGGAA